MKGLVIIKFLILFLFADSACIGQVVLSGTYQGKDIFVRNPFYKLSGEFCTQEVFVNDTRVYNQPKVSAFKIDLSGLRVNADVVIRITHAENCLPAIVNPHVLKSNDSFKFVNAETDNNSISWKTLGEKPNGVYVVNQYTEERDWTPIDTVSTKGQINENRYIIAAPHEPGLNRYKVVYINYAGLENVSEEMVYSESEQITFYPTIATTTLTLSDTAEYVITDTYGKEVKKGEGVEILVNDLKSGEYYITIQNRKKRFIKK